MSLKIECCTKWNVTHNECHSKCSFTQNVILLKIECHLKWNVTENEMSLKTECYSKCNVP